MNAIEDRLWILQETAKPSGFAPHALATKEFLISLERRGLVVQSNDYPLWMITPRGREELKRLIARSGRT